MTRGRHIPYMVLGSLAIAAPFILRSYYLRDILVSFVIFSMLALSLNIVMGYMGQYSFGHQAFFGLAAYASAMLSVKLGVSPWLGFLAGVGLATVFGFLVGFVALRAMRGVYLAIFTYAIAVTLWVFAMQSYGVTGGPSGIRSIPPLAIIIPHLPHVVFDTEISFYYLALGFLVLTVYVIISWLCSRAGQAVIATRENEELAKATGVDSFRYLVRTFAFAAALAGVAGSLYAYYLGVVNPMLFSMKYMLMMLIMVILGGTGTIGGPILGAFIYTFLLSLLPVTTQISYVILGVIVLSCIVFMPCGVYPKLQSVISRWLENRRMTRQEDGFA